MKARFYSLALLLAFAAASPVWASKSYFVNVPKGSSLTVVAPCKLKPAFYPDSASVQGEGNVATILAQDKATVTLECETGDWAYVITVNPTEDDKSAVTLLDIKDPDYDAYLDEHKYLKNLSGFDKGELLNEARSVLVAMVEKKPLEGYERKPLSGPAGVQGEISWKASYLYSGSLIGLMYKLENDSAMISRHSIKEFSAQGVIYLFSPSMDENGEIVIRPKSEALLYVVKTGGDPYYGLPWMESSQDSSMQVPFEVMQGGHSNSELSGPQFQSSTTDMNKIIPFFGGANGK